MRDEKEERKKQARSNNQTRQSNTAHPCTCMYRANVASVVIVTVIVSPACMHKRLVHSYCL